MLSISSSIKFVIWILTGTASLLFVVLLAILQPNLSYLIRKEGEVPTKKPRWLWISFWCVATLMITGTAIGSSTSESPDSPDKQSSASPKVPTAGSLLPATSQSTPEPSNSITLLSDYYLDKELDLAVLFSVEDYKKKATLETKINLFKTIQKSRGVVAFFRESNFAIRDIEFNVDGSLFASGGCSKVNEHGNCIKGKISIWEVSDSDVTLASHIEAHNDLVRAVMFNADNKTLVTGSCGRKDSNGKCVKGELIAWDISNPKNPIQREDPVNAHEGFVYDLAFITETNTFLSSGCGQVSSADNCIDGQLLSWKIANSGLRPEDLSISLQAGAIKNIVVSHDENLFVLGTEDGLISLWGFMGENSEPQLLREFRSNINGTPALAFRADDRMLFSANSDNAIKSWHILPDYSVSESQPLYAAQNSISFDPMNQFLLSAGNDKTIKVWDFSVEDQPDLIAEPFTAHNSEIYVIRSSPSGRMWVSGAKDGSVIIWDFKNKDLEKLLSYPLTGHNSDVLALAVDKDDNVMASGSCGKWSPKGTCTLGEIIFWDVTNPLSVKSIGQKILGHTGHVYSLAFSPSDRILASGGGDGSIILWNITNPESPVQIGTPLVAHKQVVQSLAFTPDGKTLASGGDDGKLILWDMSNPQLPKAINSFFTGDRRIYDIEFGSNNYGFVAADGLQELMLADNPSVNRINDSEGNIRSIAVDSQRNILATAGHSGTVYWWNTTDLNHLVKYDRTLTEQNETLLDISLGKNHNVLASGSADATIGIWYLEDYGRSMQPKPIAFFSLKGHKQNVLNLRFLSNDNFLISTGGDDKIVIWNLDPNSWVQIACRIVNRRFNRDEWTKYFPNDPYHTTCY